MLVKLTRRADQGIVSVAERGIRFRYPGIHLSRGTVVGGRAENLFTVNSSLQEFLGSLLMLSEPSESLEGSPNRSTLDIRSGAGEESGVLTSIGDLDEEAARRRRAVDREDDNAAIKESSV